MRNSFWTVSLDLDAMSANVLRLTFTDKISASPISKSYQTNQSTLFPNFDFIPEIGVSKGVSLWSDRTGRPLEYITRYFYRSVKILVTQECTERTFQNRHGRR